MKFLDVATFAAINAKLNHIDIGEAFVGGRIEAYSCKIAGTDKKLIKTIRSSLEKTANLEKSSSNGQEELRSSLERSPKNLGTSPFGPLNETQSQKTFISLIQVLNASFPDYDFSSVTSQDFKKEDPKRVVAAVDSMMAYLNDLGALIKKIWSAIDVEIRLDEADVYSYQPDPDHDPFCETPSLWHFTLFFYNKKLKRVIFFTCRAWSKITARTTSPPPELLDDDSSYWYYDQVYEDMEE